MSNMGDIAAAIDGLPIRTLVAISLYSVMIAVGILMFASYGVPQRSRRKCSARGNGRRPYLGNFRSCGLVARNRRLHRRQLRHLRRQSRAVAETALTRS